jgi:hypothetical protein
MAMAEPGDKNIEREQIIISALALMSFSTATNAQYSMLNAQPSMEPVEN